MKRVDQYWDGFGTWPLAKGSITIGQGVLDDLIDGVRGYGAAIGCFPYLSDLEFARSLARLESVVLVLDKCVSRRVAAVLDDSHPGFPLSAILGEFAPRKSRDANIGPVRSLGTAQT